MWIPGGWGQSETVYNSSYIHYICGFHTRTLERSKFVDASESRSWLVISIEMGQETSCGKTHGKWDGVLGEVDGIEVG